MEKSNVIKKIIIDYLLIIVALFFVVMVLPKLLVFFMPIVLGYIISLVANPIVRFLEEKIKMVRKHGSALVIVFVIIVVSATLYGVFYLVISQVNNIIEELPHIAFRLELRIRDILGRFDGVYNSMPYIFRQLIENIRERISLGGTGNISSLKAARLTITGITKVLIYMIFTVMSAYYFTSEKDKFLCRIRLCMPSYMMAHFRKVSQNFKSILGDYIKVQFKIMLILIVILYLGFSVFGINYALLMACIVGVLDMLPILGIGTVLIPWALGALLLSEYILAIELLVIYIICVVIREVAEPKMFGKSLGISAFATFFLMYVGLKVAGLIGLVLVLPITIVVINLYRAGAFDMLIENTKYLYDEAIIYRRKVDGYVRDINNKRRDNRMDKINNP